MKITYQWEVEQSEKEVRVISHPVNQQVVQQFERIIQAESVLTVIDPRNNRKYSVRLVEINYIETFAHLSKVYLIDGREYLLQKKLKELKELEIFHFYRINQSRIINMEQVASFTVGSQARLELFTKNGQQLTVSRHYAKQIRERLS